MCLGLWGYVNWQQKSATIKYDLRGAVRYVHSQRTPDDLLILQIPHQEWSYRYYSSDQGANPFAGSDARLGRWVGGPYTNFGEADDVANAAVDAHMRSATAGVQEVWVLFSEAEMWDARRLMDPLAGAPWPTGRTGGFCRRGGAPVSVRISGGRRWAATVTLAADSVMVWDRPLRPRRVGMVMGGGAARGIAHIGALQVLEENGIYPQIVVGTSVGALVGGLYAAGVSAARMASLVAEINWLDLVSFKLPTVNWGDLARTIPMGLVELDKLAQWVNQVIGAPVEIQHLNLTFAAVATDIVTGEVVVMNEGSLAEALRASCGVPGVFMPYRRNNRLLVDGVVVNNLPVSIAQDLGADYVIGVDLLPIGGAVQVGAAQRSGGGHDRALHAGPGDPDREPTCQCGGDAGCRPLQPGRPDCGRRPHCGRRQAMTTALPQIKADLGLVTQ